MFLTNKQIIWHVKRKSMRNVYIDTFELEDLLSNLKPTELRLYNHIMGLVIKNPTLEALSTPALAKALNASESTIKKSRAALTAQGYLVIKKFKDEDGDSLVRVVIGKDQVILYNLGLKVEITDAKAYKDLEKRFGFTNKKLTLEERKEAVTRANEYYLNQGANK